MSKHECPLCGGAIAAPSLRELLRMREVSENGEVILETLWGQAGITVSTKKIVGAIYADDPDGGPSAEVAYHLLKRELDQLDIALAGTGWGIKPVHYRKGYRL